MRMSRLTRKQIEEKRSGIEKRLSKLKESAQHKRGAEKQMDEYDMERLRAELGELDGLVASDEIK